MGDYRAMFDREYLGAWDLGDKDVTVTISKVEAGTLTTEGNKKSKRPILHFVGKEKRLVLNKTNGKTLAAMYGSKVEAWIGKQVVIYATKTNLGRERVDCIRIRNNAETATEAPQ